MPALLFPLAFIHESFTLCEESRYGPLHTHCTHQRRNGKFPFVIVLFSKNHRPIPIEGATYYLRPSNSGKRTPIRFGKDIAVAHTALINLDCDQPFKPPDVVGADPPSRLASTTARKTLIEAAREYIERSKQKSRKTYLGYRTAVNLFVSSCTKAYFDEICRDDLLDFLYNLRMRPSNETGVPIGESTVFNYFLKTMVFLNDRGIGKHVAREDWVQKKDWPVNVDKRNKNKKYATYTEQEVAAMLKVADKFGEGLIRFLVGTGFRIGEAAVAEWMDIDWAEKTVSVRFKPKFGFKPKDYEERTIVSSDTLVAFLRKYRGHAPDDALIFPSPATQTVDKHLDRVVNGLIDRANQAGYLVNKPKKPCHAFRVLYAIRRHQYGVDIETLRQELGHSDITTTQIYLRSANTQSGSHRARINRADRFSLAPSCQPFLRSRVTRSSSDLSREACRESSSPATLAQLLPTTGDRYLRTSRCAKNNSTAASLNRSRLPTRI